MPHLNDFFFTCGFPQFLQPGSACYMLHAGLLLGLFDPEDGGDTFLKNVSVLSTDYMALYGTLDSHCCENFKSHIRISYSL